MNKYLKLATSLFLPFISAVIGSYFTAESIPNWYSNINKPFFNPPNWIFGPVWTVLYFLMGVALFLIWSSNSKDKNKAIIFFVVQLIFNTLWSIIFFGLKSPLYALVDILILLILIGITIFYFYKISKVAGLILVPYFLWVSFATILNFAIYYLN